MTQSFQPPLIDTHAHLMDPRFEGDLDAVLQRAWAAGLQAIVCVGYDLESSHQAVALAATHPGIFAVVGIHPNYVEQAGPDDMERIGELTEHPAVVGIGETGLDYYRTFSEPKLQEEYLLRHVELAARRQLPVVIHNRDASARLGELLDEWARGGAPLTGVLHCFSGDQSMLERCVAAGFFISFAGPLTFKNAGWLPQMAREVPGDRVVVETDAPYLAPVPVRGRRNEPAFVAHTARRLAELRGESLATVAETTTSNARHLFASLQEPRG